MMHTRLVVPDVYPLDADIREILVLDKPTVGFMSEMSHAECRTVFPRSLFTVGWIGFG